MASHLELPNCPLCHGSSGVKVLSPILFTYFCDNCNHHFHSAMREEGQACDEQATLRKQLADANRELKTAKRDLDGKQDELRSLAEFLAREYHYHCLRALEIKDRLALNGIVIGTEDK